MRWSVGCKVWLPYVLPGLMLMGSAPVMADDMAQFFQLSMEQLLKVKISVATRSSTTINESPSTVTVYTDKDIERMGLTSLEQLLNFVAGFQSSRTDDDGRSYNPRVRGKWGTASSYDILVLLDGVRLNEPIGGGAFTQDILIAIENLKQVEIIRGPGSALYGSNAFTAVINLVSKGDENKLSFGGGSFSGKKALFNLSHRIADIDWSLFGRFYQDDGEQYPAFYNFLGLSIPTSDAMKHNDLYLRAKADWGELYLRRAGRVFDDFIVSGGLAIEGQRLKNINTSARLLLHYQPSTDVTVSPYVDYSEHFADALLALFPKQPDDMPNFFWSNGANVASIGGNIRTARQKRLGFDGTWGWQKNHQVHFGALWREESVGLNPFHGNWDAQVLEQTGEFIPSQNNEVNEGFWIDGVKFDLFTPQQREVTGYYVQDQWQVNDKMAFTSGARYDHYDDFGGNLSLRGGLVYDPESGRALKLLYGEAFRAPTFGESRAGIASGGLSNPDLQPEKVHTLEFGWVEKADWGRATATYFINKFKDTIVKVQIEDTVTGLTATTPQNSVNVDIHGIELEADIKLAEAWLLKGGYSYVTQQKEKEQVARSTAYAVINFANKPFNLNLKGYYHDKVWSRAADGVNFGRDVYLDDYWSWSLNGHYYLTEQLKLSLEVDNLFNEDFTTYSRQIGIDDGLPTRGRSVLASFTYQF